MFAIVTAYFTVVVMVCEGQTDLQRPQYACSAFHVCSFAIGLFMAALVYIGSLHILRDFLANDDPVSSGVQRGWRALYLFVSYGCVHGSLLVLDAAPVNSPSQIGPSIHRVVQRCCGKTVLTERLVKRFVFFRDSFWSAGGDFFWLKLVLLEISEIALQLNSVTTTASTSHVREISMSALLVSANLVVLPLLILLSRWIFPSLETVGICAVVLLVEVVFDKIYVSVAVLLRYRTLIQRDMGMMDQISVHGALLIPAVLTALDLQDALTLSVQYSAVTTEARKNREELDASNITNSDENFIPDSGLRRRSSMQERASHLFEEVTAKSPWILRMFLASFVMVMSVGLALGVYTAVAVHAASVDCENRIGKIASCAQQKFYFANGLFGDTTCAFERVEAFACVGDYELGAGVKALPDAVEEYERMHMLASISVPGSYLERTPAGWSSLPFHHSRGLSIDLSRGYSLVRLDYSLCASTMPLNTLRLEGTPVSTRLNWTAALNGSQILRTSLNSACLEALADLRTLSLASNGLSSGDLQLSMFPSLTRVDLRHNNLTIVTSDPADLTFRPVVQRFFDERQSGLGERGSLGGGSIGDTPVSLNFAGNDLVEFSILGATARYADEWVNVAAHTNGLAKKFSVVGAGWSDEHVARLAKLLPRSRVLELVLSTNNITAAGVKVLVGALVRSKVKKIDLSNNAIGNEGAIFLADALDDDAQWRIESIRLQRNSIGDAGVLAFARALKNMGDRPFCLVVLDNELASDKARKELEKFESKNVSVRAC